MKFGDDGVVIAFLTAGLGDRRALGGLKHGGDGLSASKCG